MSRSNVRKTLNEKILRSLRKEENERTRKAIQGTRPQVIYLEDLSFIKDAIADINEKYGKDRLKGLKVDGRKLGTARKKANDRQNKYIKKALLWSKGDETIENTPAGKVIAEKDKALFEKLGKEAFIVQSFGVLRSLKKEIIDEVVTGTEEQIKQLKAAVDRGHGSDGNAVSNLTMQRGLSQLDTVVDNPETMLKIQDDLRDYVDNAIKSGEIHAEFRSEIENVITNYETNITKAGKVRADYVPYITFQSKYRNRGVEQARETASLNLLRKFFEEQGSKTLVEMEGSPSIRDRMIARAIEPFIEKPAKGKKVRIDAKIDARKLQFKTKGKAKTKNKEAGHKLSIAATKKQNIATNRMTKAKSSSVNLANILGVLNAKLPTAILRNMNPPALESRTGRFAASVKAVDMATTNQGFPSIGYTYRKDPYQVFESSSGTRFSSTDRDPRVLIDKSIREIMSQYLIGRLYTRRV